jgi:hypothetical protein
MEENFIKINKNSISNPLFKKPLIWHYFQYCLLKANCNNTPIVFNCKEFIIETDCFITTGTEASIETGLSRQNIRTAIKTLVNFKMIEKVEAKSTMHFTYIRILNFDHYKN